MIEDYWFRWAGPLDYDGLGTVMYDAVRGGDSLYDEAERAAWVPEPRRGKSWTKRLSGQHIIVAEKDNEIVGFMSLTPQNYIDFAYIRPQARGQGLFRELYQRIENKAFARGAKRLNTHASLMAQPAFAAMGFSEMQKEQVVISGAKLERCAMQKRL